MSFETGIELPDALAAALKEAAEALGVFGARA
jgi:hypothetical protein